LSGSLQPRMNRTKSPGENAVSYLKLHVRQVPFVLAYFMVECFYLSASTCIEGTSERSDLFFLSGSQNKCTGCLLCIWNKGKLFLEDPAVEILVRCNLMEGPRLLLYFISQ